MNRRPLILCLQLALGIFLLTGCKTPPPGAEGSLAWVEIKGQTGPVINDAVDAVFKQNGYHLKKALRGEAVYQKPGSTSDNIAWGDWSSGVSIRVNVRVNPKPNGVYLVFCDASIIRSADDPVMEETQKIHFRRAPYQQLLDEVKAKLDKKQSERTLSLSATNSNQVAAP